MGFDEAAWRREYAEKQAEKQAARRRARVESRETGKVCAECGGDLSRRPAYRVSDYGSPFVMMCEECAPEWLVSGRGKPMRIIPEVEVHAWDCAGCGRQVVFGMSPNQYRKRVYCSDECRRTWRRNPKNREPYTNTCEVCGREFEAKRSDAKTCSPACRQKAYRQRRTVA
jgi:hypothetical protein